MNFKHIVSLAALLLDHLRCPAAGRAVVLRATKIAEALDFERDSPALRIVCFYFSDSGVAQECDGR